jgi:hypothetical protein
MLEIITIIYHFVEILFTGDFIPHNFLPVPIFEDDPALELAYVANNLLS